MPILIPTLSQAPTNGRAAPDDAEEPKPGDLEVKGRDETGHQWYAWNGIEVPVTPRELRPRLIEGASAKMQKIARETTPDRAWRKIKRRIDYKLKKVGMGRATNYLSLIHI